LTFLDVNGIKLTYSDSDIVTLGIGIADDTFRYEEVLNWINGYKNIDSL